MSSCSKKSKKSLPHSFDHKNANNNNKNNDPKISHKGPKTVRLNLALIRDCANSNHKT